MMRITVMYINLSNRPKISFALCNVDVCDPINKAYFCGLFSWPVWLNRVTDRQTYRPTKFLVFR